MTTFTEPPRDIPVAADFDVIVCGGGPAGVAAAIASARGGARTALLESQGCLGGVWTAGLLGWILDSDKKIGIMREITQQLDQRGARLSATTGVAYDPEAMKLLLEEMCLKAGVHVRLHTQVVSAGVDSDHRLRVAVTESKSGREAWQAQIFVDATGDGDLSAQAGCSFDIGAPETGETQPMSLLAMVAGIHLNDVSELLIGADDLPAKRRLYSEMERAGVPPSYALPVLLPIRDNLFALHANHEYGASAVDAADVTSATFRSRAELHRIVNSLQGLGGRWSDLRIVATASQIGVREARRVHGLYTVGEADMLDGARHDDAVCRVHFGIDVHSPDPTKSKTFTEDNRTATLPYDIPLRAQIAADVDGLLLAGRCISGDFLAHSSYRVTGNAVALGQSAGVVAALAANGRRLPQEVAWSEVAGALDTASSEHDVAQRA